MVLMSMMHMKLELIEDDAIRVHRGLTILSNKCQPGELRCRRSRGPIPSAAMHSGESM